MPPVYISASAWLFPARILRRNFQPERRIELLQIKFCWEQLDDLDAEDFGEKEQLAVRGAPELRFQFCHGFTADMTSQPSTCSLATSAS
jgi:hypothetical protein